VKVLGEPVSQCDALIAIIGPRWLDAKDDAGRLENPDDFVRIEIESALDQGKRVIPVLANKAAMPSAGEWPIH
jgi:hypothetical protein